jgi:hypothetical protein
MGGQPPATRTPIARHMARDQTFSLNYSSVTAQSVHDDYARGVDGSSTGTTYGDFVLGVMARYERSYRWRAEYAITYGQTQWNQVYNNKGEGAEFGHAEVTTFSRCS